MGGNVISDVTDYVETDTEKKNDRCLNDDSGYYEDEDYNRNTWDAMTDGMYGDMPDGFDDDYDFLG